MARTKAPAPIFAPRQRSLNRASIALAAASEALTNAHRLAVGDGSDVTALERALLHARRARYTLDNGANDGD